MYAEQVEQFGAVENGLCFGRLDVDDGTRRYIGRIGIFDDARRLRAAADGLAGPGRPAVLPRHRRRPREGVRRRRHIRTRQRKVTGLDDEVLDLDAAAGPAATRG